jgi:hypothetical protein
LVSALGRRKDLGNIHHLDEDFTNDSPENLDVGHHACHTGHHSSRPRPDTTARLEKAWANGQMQGHPQTTETRAKISAGLIGHPVSEETRNKIANTLRGRPHTDERRANLRAGWVKRKARTAQLKQQGEMK